MPSAGFVDPEAELQVDAAVGKGFEEGARRRVVLYLRRNSKTKAEVSIDEPLNVDWDGNELLLSDILGTDEDVIYKDIENQAERLMLGKA